MYQGGVFPSNQNQRKGNVLSLLEMGYTLFFCPWSSHLTFGLQDFHQCLLHCHIILNSLASGWEWQVWFSVSVAFGLGLDHYYQHPVSSLQITYHMTCQSVIKWSNSSNEASLIHLYIHPISSICLEILCNTGGKDPAPCLEHLLKVFLKVLVWSHRV